MTKMISTFLFLTTVVAAPVLAGTGATVVYPTGIFPDDVVNVFNATRAGGKVVLKATDTSGTPRSFEFGGGWVRLPLDTTIVGENVHHQMTTIHRGGLPFRDAGVPAHIAIRGIHFDAPIGAALYLNWASGVEFTDNIVTDVVGIQFGPYTKGQGVWLAELQAPFFTPSFITGTIVIAHNTVQRVYADLSYGVALAGVHAKARIMGNSFIDTRDTGVLVVGDSEPFLIEDNVIVAGDGPFPGFFSAGNGIFTGQGSGAAFIRRNTIFTGNPDSDGIALSGCLEVDCGPGMVQGASVVERNLVSMHTSQFGGITTYGAVLPSLIRRNTVVGDAAYALDISSYVGDESVGGFVFLRNDVRAFTGSVADVFFDSVAHDTIFVGRATSAVDLGANDVLVSSYAELSQMAKSRVAAAFLSRAALLQQLRQCFSDASDGETDPSADLSADLTPLTIVPQVTARLNRQFTSGEVRGRLALRARSATEPPQETWLR